MEHQFIQPEVTSDALLNVPAPPGPVTYTTIPPEEAAWALGLARKLKRRDPLRRMAEEIANGDRRTLDTIEPAISAFNMRGVSKWREKALAAWVLGRAVLTPIQRRVAGEQITYLLADRSSGFGGMWCAAGCPLTWPLAIIMAIVSSVTNSWQCNARRAAAEALGRLRDPGCLGPLISVLYEPGSAGLGGLRNAARAAFPAVVSALTPDYYGYLSGMTIHDLCKTLNHPDELIVESALDALGKAGTGQAVLPVQNVVARGSKHMKEKARAVLPILLQRRTREQASQMLLRPFTGSVSEPGTLLRPAGGTHEADVRRLLRPTDAEES